MIGEKEASFYVSKNGRPCSSICKVCGTTVISKASKRTYCDTCNLAVRRKCRRDAWLKKTVEERKDFYLRKKILNLTREDRKLKYSLEGGPGTHALGRESVDYLLQIGLGNTLRPDDYAKAGYGEKDIPMLREQYPDSLFPSSDTAWFSSSLLIGGECGKVGCKTYAFREGERV